MKNIAGKVFSWAIIVCISIAVTTVIIARDNRAANILITSRVEKLEVQRNVTARLICKIALAVNALKTNDDKELSGACASLIGI